jgi:phage anti-repressor protein
MKKKSNGMSPDMFHDATSSTPIPVFTNANDAAPNAPSEPIPSVTDVPEVSFDANPVQNELIKIDFDKQTVSARALYDFLGMTERFSNWCKRYFTQNFVKNIDYTPTEFFVKLNRIAKRDYGDFLLTLKMAKSIAIMHRSEKGKEACNYFTNIENRLCQQLDTNCSIQGNITLPITNLTSKGDSDQNELIKIDFDKQRVSARTLYHFFESAERFSKWCKRMFSYGLLENVDYTAVPHFTSTVPFSTVNVNLDTSVKNSEMEEIDDYLLTIDAAKHIAMVQRNEKGKQARDYFINIEKLYWKKRYSKTPTVETPISLLENLDRIVAQFDNLRSSIVLLEKGNAQQQQLQKNYDSLIEKTIALEKTVVEQATVSNLKEEYIERTISKKIDIALKTSFREAEQIKFGNEWGNSLPSATNPNTVVVLNQLEKNLQKTTLEEDLIRKWYRPAERKTEHALFLTATDITLHLETFSKKVGVRNVGVALKKLGFERLHRGIGGHQTKGYYVIQLH